MVKPVAVAKRRYVEKVRAARMKQCEKVAEFLGVPAATVCATAPARAYQAFAETPPADKWFNMYKLAYTGASS